VFFLFVSSSMDLNEWLIRETFKKAVKLFGRKDTPIL